MPRKIKRKVLRRRINAKLRKQTIRLLTAKPIIKHMDEFETRKPKGVE